MSEKISVSRQGGVLRVAEDLATNRPVRISSYNEEPPGCFMQTFHSPSEIWEKYGRYELLFLDPPAPPKENAVQPLSAEQSRKVQELLQKSGIANPKPHDTHAAPQKTRVVTEATETGHALRGAPSNYMERASEFLKRLQVAREYASKKNQRELDIKIQAITELISEVFGE